MSVENIESRIMREAGDKAAALLAQAGTEAEAILKDGKIADARAGAEALRDARVRLERETNRELERLQHDNRLQILSAKNKAIDEVFRRVGRKLAEMSDDEYIGLVASWLDGLPAEAGGALRVNPRDVDKFTARLSVLNRARAGKGVFTGVAADPKVPNGAVVDGPDYTVDCSVTRRLAELRESSAGLLAKALFGA